MTLDPNALKAATEAYRVTLNGRDVVTEEIITAYLAALPVDEGAVELKRSGAEVLDAFQGSGHAPNSKSDCGRCRALGQLQATLSTHTDHRTEDGR